MTNRFSFFHRASNTEFFFDLPIGEPLLEFMRIKMFGMPPKYLMANASEWRLTIKQRDQLAVEMEPFMVPNRVWPKAGDYLMGVMVVVVEEMPTQVMMRERIAKALYLLANPGMGAYLWETLSVMESHDYYKQLDTVLNELSLPSESMALAGVLTLRGNGTTDGKAGTPYDPRGWYRGMAISVFKNMVRAAGDSQS